MNLISNTITGISHDLIKTEILFFIAEAKATGASLIKLYAQDAQTNAVIKILKNEKRAGSIQLFVHSDSLEEKTTEMEYLKNIYPSLSEISSQQKFFLLKV